MMDKNREAFEAWCKSSADLAVTMRSYPVRAISLQAWKASRAAIEIELPEGTGWASDPYNHGRNDGINQCTKAITSHGIRIKGKTE